MPKSRKRNPKSTDQTYNNRKINEDDKEKNILSKTLIIQ